MGKLIVRQSKAFKSKLGMFNSITFLRVKGKEIILIGTSRSSHGALILDFYLPRSNTNSTLELTSNINRYLKKQHMEYLP